MIEDNINSYVDVIEHPRVFQWFNDLAEKDPALFYVFTRDNTLYLKRFFGQPQKNKHPMWKESWFCIHKGLQFKILSGKYGTVFLCRAITTIDDFKKDFSLGISVINFLEETLSKISGKN